jgi:GTP-binding protein
MPIHQAVFFIMIVDEVTVELIAGNGGNGCLSFRREKYVPKGGPDGGDGGVGGSVYVESSAHFQTLNHIRNLQKFKAKNGGSGRGRKMKGADGKDIIIKVPPGTLVLDADSEEIIIDFDSRIEKRNIVKGGDGGLGNVHFKSSTNQAPRRITKGKEGEYRKIRLELKLLADVGLIGLPNAGKSSFLSKVSRATPKIADYPFTTLNPQLGMVRFSDIHSFTIADIPGLIEGAHEGTGLGDRFLRHIERTKYLIHVIDISNKNEQKCIEDYTMIREELEQYNPDLTAKPELVAFNKTDLVDNASFLQELRKHFETINIQCFSVSAKTGDGLEDVIQFVGDWLIKNKIRLYGDILEV